MLHGLIVQCNALMFWIEIMWIVCKHARTWIVLRTKPITTWIIKSEHYHLRGCVSFVLLGERWLEKCTYFLTTMMVNDMFTFTKLTIPILKASVSAGSILFVTECRVCTISVCIRTFFSRNVLLHILEENNNVLCFNLDDCPG